MLATDVSIRKTGLGGGLERDRGLFWGKQQPDLKVEHLLKVFQTSKLECQKEALQMEAPLFYVETSLAERKSRSNNTPHSL